VEEDFEDTLNLLIREDDENQFLDLFRKDECKAFEVIVNHQHIFQFIVILETQIDTETLKFLMSEFIANNLIPNDIIGSLRNSTYTHFRSVDTHLESFYDNLIIKLFKGE